MTKSEIRKKIEMLERRCHSIGKYLPYADGQAYYNDKREIEEMEREISKLTKMMLEARDA